MDKDTLITSPSANFVTVKELLDCERLTWNEKITALENWKSTCEQLQTSTDEGMEDERYSTARNQLVEVTNALGRLKH